MSSQRELDEILADAGEVALYLWQKGWAERNAGNISIDVTALLPAEPSNALSPSQPLAGEYADLGGRCFLVTGTGKRMRDLPRRPADNASIIRLTVDGASYTFAGGEDFACQPTSELNSHLAIHQLLVRRGAPQRAVLHTHPNELLALTHLPAYNDETMLNHLLWSMHPETKAVVPEGVGLAPYRAPGSEGLEAVTLGAMATHRVVIWEKHGAVAVGSDVFEAFDLIDTLNKSAQVYFLCASAGAQPQGLTDAQVAEIGRRQGAPAARS